ncbi:mini-chromosome maintenance complex-binding protein-like [Pyrus ussuriensis x Pyrus communis]|uniref:Mini-chromosome maintenance complex-binding protein-like n=1 Tax=Pyrus ussuriensis x Pyrus communis TaxID=2448454 RepID=A0A5N5HLR4_9ROSA|nr:mini-chromosome maintenance complex-binding protein-like [Pyrus ussuriensis x Pyrus communis]
MIFNTKREQWFWSTAFFCLFCLLLFSLLINLFVFLGCQVGRKRAPERQQNVQSIDGVVTNGSSSCEENRNMKKKSIVDFNKSRMDTDDRSNNLVLHIEYLQLMLDFTLKDILDFLVY